MLQQAPTLCFLNPSLVAVVASSQDLLGIHRGYCRMASGIASYRDVLAAYQPLTRHPGGQNAADAKASAAEVLVPVKRLIGHSGAINFELRARA